MKAVRSPGVNVLRIVRRHANEIQATDGCKSDTKLDLLILGGRQRQIAAANDTTLSRTVPLLLDKDHPGRITFIVASWATSVEGRAHLSYEGGYRQPPPFSGTKRFRHQPLSMLAPRAKAVILFHAFYGGFGLTRLR
jgi:hypothetical protein